jgi:epoxyqueuosine reductase QueG
MESRIKEFALASGAALCGIAGAERFADAPQGFHPSDIYADCRSVVVLAKAMPKGLAFVSPRIIYNHAGDINIAELDRIVFEMAMEIERMGGIAVPLPSDGPYDCWDGGTLTGKGLLSMRHAAVLAGLGSLGKNTLLINRQYGNMLGLGAVLTDLPLRSDALSEELCIPGCRRCLDACPVHALDGVSANQQLCRPNTYGTNARGFGVVNCNRCRVVCPRALGDR